MSHVQEPYFFFENFWIFWNFWFKNENFICKFFIKKCENSLLVTWTKRVIVLEHVPGRLSDIYLWHSVFGTFSPTPGQNSIFYLIISTLFSALYFYLFISASCCSRGSRETTCLQNKNHEFGIYSNEISVFSKLFTEILKHSLWYS